MNQCEGSGQQGLLDFKPLSLDYSWAFIGADTRYLTHDIHRYPAKFIPQVAGRIIREYSTEGGVILDPFCGSGTALLEARLAGRNAIGVDVNPIAYYVSKVKADPIEPRKLEALWRRFSEKLNPPYFSRVEPYRLPGKALRILEAWVPERQLEDMRRLFTLIMSVEDRGFRDFLLVAFSNIQKECSWWSMRSVKPVRDYGKNVPSVIPSFIRQAERMIMKNNQLWDKLKDSETWVKVFRADSRMLSTLIEDPVDLILFSPPYVTSYEYVDLHKLSIVWLEETGDLRGLKRSFIGSIRSKPRGRGVRSRTASRIISMLGRRDERLRRAVEAYFEDMEASFSEMDKVLRSKGIVAMVIGNTRLRGVEVKNAEALAEIFLDMGYRLEKTIKRPIPGKNLPTARDPKTGRFASASSTATLIYPYEYILILRKT